MVSTRARRSPGDKKAATAVAAATPKVPKRRATMAPTASAASTTPGPTARSASPSRKKAPKSRADPPPPQQEVAAAPKPKQVKVKIPAKAATKPPSVEPASSFEYEFGGPWGALGIIIGLPVVVLGLYYCCPNYVSSFPSSTTSSPFSFQSSSSPLACLRWTDLAYFLTTTLPATLKGYALEINSSPREAAHALLSYLQTFPALAQNKGIEVINLVKNELWDPMAFLVIVAWFLFQVLLERVLPGEIALGVPLPGTGGKRLSYKLNGHLAFWITLLVMGHGCPKFASPVLKEVGIEPSAAMNEGDEVQQVLGEVGEVVTQAAEEVVSGGRMLGGALMQAAEGIAGGWRIPAWEDLVGFGAFPLEELYDRFPQFAFAAVVFSFGLAVCLYVLSFRRGVLLAEGGRSGNVLYDFYMGRELNPRSGGFDWKYFCELRPGLIGWAVLNLGMLMKQQQLQQVTGEGISWPLVLVCVFQGWYVLDALLNERAILTTMDITTDGFGFMLAFGDLAWVPFTYSLQARYLVGRPVSVGGWVAGGLAGLHLLGYWIFRRANSTKDVFRRDPGSVPHVKFLETARGTKLMISGWWGWARKINYTGDWMMGLAWCGLCGPVHVLPYFYAIYFGVLLVHRAARDDHLCAVKYGEDWEKYKAEVRWLFLPGVY